MFNLHSRILGPASLICNVFMNHLWRPSYVCKRCLHNLPRAPEVRPKILIPGHKFQGRLSSHVAQKSKGLRVAVVGSGPAGFYASYRLMSKAENAKVDMYEQLPVPFGLVRYGVAPDHPEVKNCQDKFTEVAQDPRFNFIGNISLGHDISLPSLVPHYDAILFAYGASKDKELGLPGERYLQNQCIYSARAFVGWYNGLPEYSDLKPDLRAGPHVTIIGQGNVALDVARILLSPIDILAKTDISAHALEVLSKSTVKHVRVVGRRGPLQAAFTIKELREIMNLPSVHFVPIDGLLLPPSDATSSFPRPQKRLLELLHKRSPTSSTEATKTISLDFLLSPIGFNPSDMFSRTLKSIQYDCMSLPPEPECWSPSARSSILLPLQGAQLKANIAFRSIGYQSEPLPDFDALHIPFDESRGIIPNDSQGRVLDPYAQSGAGGGGHLPGFYCTGWVKNGPTGTIATTMMDAFNVADAIAEDWHNEQLRPFLNGTRAKNLGNPMGWEGVEAETRQAGLGLRRVSWEDWQKIDRAEKERGKWVGKEREKFADVEEMLGVL